MNQRVLSDYIRVRPHFQRSVNLERDVDSDVGYYVPTARAIDTIRQWAVAMREPERPRAWSITGPYGAGKSSFALFLDALSAAAGSAGRLSAERRLQEIDAGLTTLLSEGRERLGVGNRGFIRAIVTAEREPASKTLMRALRAGAKTYWPTRMPIGVSRAFSHQGEVPSARDVLAALRALSERAPVLLVIDEFGKNLEAFADGETQGDLFVVQEVAEQVSGEAGLPVFFFTLQHLAFSDYALGLSEQQRREWSKVQGRFEDIPFFDSADQAIHVLADTFDHSKVPSGQWKRIWSWARKMRSIYHPLGLSSVLPGPDLIAACYPLHPAVVAALPELCSRYAQNSRTLFSFVAGPEPGSVASWLKQQFADADPLPVITLEDVYEYFVQSVGILFSASGESSRWLEIEQRLRETQGLSAGEVRCLRVIGILNLIASGGALRASGSMLEALLMDSGSMAAEDVRQLLRNLVRRGLLAYRDFADEYRIWEGSDFDITRGVADSKERLASRSIADLLETVAPSGPLVVARHSQRTGILRYFTPRFADERTEEIEFPSEADGLVIYQLGELSRWVTESLRVDPRPVVVVPVIASTALREGALEVAAHRELLEKNGEVARDRVARRELQEREALLQDRLSATIATALGSDGVRAFAQDREDWDLRGPLNLVLSELCDRWYPQSPVVRNEMISRRELTSQGAKARRELLNAMVDHCNQERLGLTGYGPARSMYEAILNWTGLHRQIDAETWAFQPPPRGSSWWGAWKTVERLVHTSKSRHVSALEVWQALAAPPVGMKAGAIAVLFTAALIYWADEVAIYQDGTYQTALDAALLERLLKMPERFHIRAFSLMGTRVEIVRAIASELGSEARRSRRQRNSSVLSVVAPMLTRVKALPAYAHRTHRVSELAVAVRTALANAREPDQLLFIDLPCACGLPRFGSGQAVPSEEIVQFARRLRGALGELDRSYQVLLSEIQETLAREFGVPTTVPLREGLRARAAALVDKVLDPRIRSPLLMACNESLDDKEWVEAMAMTVGDRPPQEWRDEDVDQFGHNVRDVAVAFARIEALHFERRAAQQEGFDARRVTVTSPDGSEVSRVVYVGQSVEEAAERAAVAALQDLEPTIGRDAVPALLATLAKRMYPSADDPEAFSTSAQPEETTIA